MQLNENSNDIIDCNDCILNKLSGFYLSSEEQKQICSNASKLHFAKGETILKQGSNSSSIGFLHKGIVKFTFLKEVKKNYIMTIVSGPKLIGHSNLFFKEKNIFSTIAIEECDVCFLENRKIVSILETHGKFTLFLVERSLDMFQSSIFNFISLAHKHVNGRIADILIFLWENVYKNTEYEFTLSRKEIAEFAACSHVNVISVLSAFNKEGIVSFEGKKIIINDMEKLNEISKKG